MAVYIKGMEMPTGCGTCQFCHVEGFVSWCCPTGREDIFIDAIPDWCPLTEIPEPHGRLIDADALEKNNCELWRCDFSHPRYGDTLEDIIGDAPTVIEGSEE